MKSECKTNSLLMDRATAYVKEISFIAKQKEKDMMVNSIYEALKWSEQQHVSRKKSLAVTKKKKWQEDEEFEDWEELKIMLRRQYPEAWRRLSPRFSDQPKDSV